MYGALGTTRAAAINSNPLKTTATAEAQRPGSLDVAAISGLNLFGAIVSAPAIDPANLPATQLNLKLAGIFNNTHNEYSRALIAEEGKPAKPYFIGDSLPGDAKLRSIDNDFVIIQRGERLEKLPLHNSTIASTVPARHTVLPSIALANPQPSSAPAPQLPASGVTAQTVYKGLEDRLAAIRQTRTTNTP